MDGCLPSWLSEEDFLHSVNQACNILAKNFVFGYYDEMDIRQEAYIFALEAIGRYDRDRPLPNFIYTHIRNRLINFKRDKFHRNDPPCALCFGGGSHEDGEICMKFKLWRNRNSVKRNLMRPNELDDYSHVCKEVSVVESVNYSEMLDKIDMELPVEYRSLYLRMRCGESVPKSKREMIMVKIKEILNVS